MTASAVVCCGVTFTSQTTRTVVLELVLDKTSTKSQENQKPDSNTPLIGVKYKEDITRQSKDINVILEG